MSTSAIKVSTDYRAFLDEETQGVPAALADRWWTFSGLVSFLASATTAFTVSLVGEMPVGEFFLIGAAAAAVLCMVFNQAPPGRLFRSRYFWVLMVAQLVALVAYVVSD